MSTPITLNASALRAVSAAAATPARVLRRRHQYLLCYGCDVDEQQAGGPLSALERRIGSRDRAAGEMSGWSLAGLALLNALFLVASGARWAIRGWRAWTGSSVSPGWRTCSGWPGLPTARLAADDRDQAVADSLSRSSSPTSAAALWSRVADRARHSAWANAGANRSRSSVSSAPPSPSSGSRRTSAWRASGLEAFDAWSFWVPSQAIYRQRPRRNGSSASSPARPIRS